MGEDGRAVWHPGWAIEPFDPLFDAWVTLSPARRRNPPPRSRLAAITSFVPCPKAYEGGTWDIAKNKSALQGVVPAEPSPATFRRILSPESIQATAPPDRVPRQREHFCPKLLADSGGGMIPSWDAMSNRHQTSSRPRRPETVLHRQ